MINPENDLLSSDPLTAIASSPPYNKELGSSDDEVVAGNIGAVSGDAKKRARESSDDEEKDEEESTAHQSKKRA